MVKLTLLTNVPEIGLKTSLF